MCFLFVVFTKKPLGFEINALFTPFLAPIGHPIELCLTRFQVCLFSIPKLRLVRISNLKAQGWAGRKEGKVPISRGHR